MGLTTGPLRWIRSGLPWRPFVQREYMVELLEWIARPKNEATIQTLRNTLDFVREQHARERDDRMLQTMMAG